MGASLVGCSKQKCEVCPEQSEPEPAHEHTFSSEWSSNDAAHWHAATCEHTDLTKDMANHSFGQWRTIDEPTETAVGRKERTCSVCQYVQSAEIAKLDHTHNWGPWVIEVEATEDHAGKKHRECSCGATQEEVIDQLAHTHTFSEAWASNEEGHWHEATCGHSATTDIEPHTPDREAPDFKTPVKCSVCGRVLEESLINAAVDMSNDEYTIKPGQTRYFVLRNVGEPTELKVNIDYISGGSNDGSIKPEMLGISNPSATYANKTTVKDFASITKAELSGGRITLTSGKYVNVTTVLLVFAVTNNMSNVIVLRLNNVTYEYKMTYSSVTTINGHQYKIERFTAQNGVDDIYYAVYNNSSGARIGVYRDLKIKNPDVLSDGSVEWKDANGDLKQFTLPHTLYKSQHYKTSDIWYPDELYEGRLYMWLGDLSKFVDFLMNDEIYGVPGLFATNSEEQFEAFAAFAEDNVQFTLTDFYNQFDFEDGGAPYGVKEYESISDDAIAMDYNSSNRQFRYVGDTQYSQDRRIKVLKLTTPDTIQYDKFFSYDQNGAIRQAVGPHWSTPFLYRIVDSNLNEVAGYDKLTNSGFRQNANGENLRLMPNQTYYIVGYQWLFGYNFVVSQRRFSINILTHEIRGLYSEGQRIAFIDDRVSGQTTMINACYNNPNHVASDSEAMTFGKAIVGYTTSATDTQTITHPHYGTVTPVSDDVNLYAVYEDIEEKHIITTPAYINSYSTSGNVVEMNFDHILDSNIDSLEVGDAVFFVPKEGYASRYECFVAAIDAAQSKYTFSGVPSYVMSKLAYISLETEFDSIFALDVNGYNEKEVVINKGESYDLALLYDLVSIPSGEFLEFWEDLDNSDTYEANTFFTPYHSTIYIPYTTAIRNSKLLTLYKEFETGENNAGASYIEFVIKDGNATLNSDSNIVMVMRDGSTVTDSVFRILDSSNSTISSATSGSGTIKVFLNATTIAQLNNVVKMKIAN